MKKRVTRNKFEESLLRDLITSGLEVKYEGEKLPYTITANYYPDYIITLKSGKKIYIEAKGHFRREAKTKMAAVKLCHPELDIRFVFYKPDKTNIRWAVKHKYPYAISKIPQEWLDE